MMRLIIPLLLISLFFFGCKKDKFTTEPQIKFKSIGPTVMRNLPGLKLFVTFQLTDKDGDFGFKGEDSSYVYVRAVSIPGTTLDSVKFPDLSLKTDGSMDAEITADISSALATTNTGTTEKIDTLFFEIYVQDFAKNKSNVITTTDPIYYITP